MNGEAPRRVNFAPILTAIVLTVLLLWLFKTVAGVFLLLFIAVLISLYLGAVAEWFEHRLRLAPRLAFAVAILVSLGALVLLLATLIPPVVQQTEALIKQLPDYITSWETDIDHFVDRFPPLQQAWGPAGQHRLFQWITGWVTDHFSGAAGSVAGKLSSGIAVLIDIFAVGVMGIYLAVHPALYREWLIALFPPIHRDLVRDVLSDLADALRTYIGAQLLDMAFLGAITMLGLFLLHVPFYVPFGVFAGLAAIVPFFGTLFATLIPSLFVLNTGPWAGFTSGAHALMVVGLGVVVHLIEGNLVSPLIMSKRVDLPPVLTIVSVLIMGELLGGLGLLVALPTLAAAMVQVRRILISRIYEGQGFRKSSRDRALVLRVPGQEGGILVPAGLPIDVVTEAERTEMRVIA